jgi:hypothetical protein
MLFAVDGPVSVEYRGNAHASDGAAQVELTARRRRRGSHFSKGGKRKSTLCRAQRGSLFFFFFFFFVVVVVCRLSVLLVALPKRAHSLQ